MPRDSRSHGSRMVDLRCPQGKCVLEYKMLIFKLSLATVYESYPIISKSSLRYILRKVYRIRHPNRKADGQML